MRHLYFDGVLRPFGSALALRLPAQISVRSVTITSLSMSLFGSALIVLSISLDESKMTSLMGVLLWQFAMVLDCADGQLARLRKTSSPGGSALDATADVVAMAGIGVAVVFGSNAYAFPLEAQQDSRLSLMTTIAATLVGISLWSTAPLSTVAKSALFDLDSSNERTRAPKRSLPNSISRSIWGIISDWSLIVLALGVAIFSGSKLALLFAIGWLFVSGMLMAITRLLRYLSLSN